MVGYAVIGLTFGYGREFVNATFFQWSDEFIKNFDWLFSKEVVIVFFVPSFALGKDLLQVRNFDVDLFVFTSLNRPGRFGNY